MRILIHAATSVCPYYDGASLRTFRVAPYLSRNNKLDLIQERWQWEHNAKALNPLGLSDQWLEKHFDNIWNVWHKPGEKLRYGIIWESQELYDTLDKILANNQYDVIWAPGEAYPLYAKLRNRYDIPVITGSTDSFHLQYWRSIQVSSNFFKTIKILIKWCLFTIYQIRVLNRMPYLIMVADKDARSIRYLSRRCEIRVIPYGVDIAYFMPPEDNKRNTFQLVFVGTLGGSSTNEIALEWFIKKVWDKVLHNEPRAKLEIIGPNFSDRLNFLCKKAGSIVLRGYAPDIRKYLWVSSIFILPMRSGGGIKNKLLEAWASGCAVVSTTLGAEGVPESCHEENILLADDPKLMAEGILRLFKEPKLIINLCESGYNIVKQKYTWEESARQLESYLTEVAHNDDAFKGYGI